MMTKLFCVSIATVAAAVVLAIATVGPGQHDKARWSTRWLNEARPELHHPATWYFTSGASGHLFRTTLEADGSARTERVPIRTNAFVYGVESCEGALYVLCNQFSPEERNGGLFRLDQRHGGEWVSLLPDAYSGRWFIEMFRVSAQSEDCQLLLIEQGGAHLFSVATGQLRQVADFGDLEFKPDRGAWLGNGVFAVFDRASSGAIFDFEAAERPEAARMKEFKLPVDRIVSSDLTGRLVIAQGDELYSVPIVDLWPRLADRALLFGSGGRSMPSVRRFQGALPVLVQSSELPPMTLLSNGRWGLQIDNVTFLQDICFTAPDELKAPPDTQN